MKSYRVTDFNQPIEEHDGPIPEPQGTEVLMRVTRAGVCHSDLHIWEGFYDFGGGSKLSLGERGLTPPITMGHEIFGEIVKAGPDAGDVAVGAPRLIYPWLGCGECPTCLAERENHCLSPQSLGVFRPGGYAEYCLVPHPKHLVDIGDTDPSLATPYACSGVTVYSALLKAMPIEKGEWLTIMGAGGLGLNAVAIARALGIENILSCDLDDQKLAAAGDIGATATVNAGAADSLEQIKKITGGGPRAVVDTVGAEATANLGIAALPKGGRYVIVGLYGGGLTVPLPSLPLRAISIIGSYVGNLNELKELMELVKTGAVPAIPVATRPLAEVGQTLEDLRAGRIIGRVVLTN